MVVRTMHWQLLVLLLLPVCVAVWRQLHCCWRSSLPTAPPRSCCCCSISSCRYCVAKSKLLLETLNLPLFAFQGEQLL